MAMNSADETLSQNTSADMLVNPLTGEGFNTEVFEYEAVPLNMRTLASVALDTVKNFKAPRQEPLHYPGLRPESGFTLGVNGSVLPVEISKDPKTGELNFYINTENGVWNLNDALKEAGATPIEDRIPVVTFGSNANPGQLVDKFAQHVESGELKAEDSYFIPTTEATIEDLAPVYVPKVGIWKYSFSTLFPLEGATTSVHVNWLTREQLEIMHTTEKAYEFCEFGEATITGGDLNVPAYMYVAKGASSAYLDAEGKPVVMEGANVEGVDIRVISQQEIQDELLDETRQALLAEFPHLTHEELSSIAGLHETINSMPEHTPVDASKYPDARYKKMHVGNMMVEELISRDRVATESLIDRIPEDKIGVAPMTLAEILHNK